MGREPDGGARRKAAEVLRAAAGGTCRHPAGLSDVHEHDRRPRAASGDGMTPRPPAFALWLLTRRTPADWRDFVIGDLDEEFRDRHAISPAAARRWFWRQTLRCLVTPLPAP